MDIYTLHFDGSCGPKNPGGTAAYGFTLDKNRERITAGHAVIGTGPQMSNNVAEYAALYEGLAEFAERYTGGEAIVNVKGDSKLVIQQMRGRWAVRGGLYLKNYHMAAGLVSNLRTRGVKINFEWIPREENAACDDLSKKHQTAECDILSNTGIDK